MSGFNTPFDCYLHYEAVHPNEDAPTTCAKEEWEYAVDGKVPKYIASGKFRLKELYSKAGRVSDIYRKTATGTATSDLLSPPERLGLALYTGPMVRRLRPSRCLNHNSNYANAVQSVQQHLAPECHEVFYCRQILSAKFFSTRGRQNCRSFDRPISLCGPFFRIICRTSIGVHKCPTFEA